MERGWRASIGGADGSVARWRLKQGSVQVEEVVEREEERRVVREKRKKSTRGGRGKRVWDQRRGVRKEAIAVLTEILIIILQKKRRDSKNGINNSIFDIFH